MSNVILLLNNLFIVELATLLFSFVIINEKLMQNTLISLHVIFDVLEDLSKSIQMLHLFFRDFLINNVRCSNLRF